MTTRGEYTTVPDVRTAYLSNSATATGDDALILNMIRAASKDINDIGGLKYYPVIETRYFDVPRRTAPSPYWAGEGLTPTRAPLVLDVPLGALTTLTNGDASVISASDYLLYPYNSYPKEQVWFKRSSTAYWTPTAAGDYERALALLGVWTAHPDYANAWVDSTTTAGAIGTTTATSFTSSNGALLKAGWLIKIDSEIIYISSISSNTVTIVRGVNGSTAATHSASAPVYYWEVPAGIELLCQQATAAYYKLKSNPVGETVNLDGAAFSTPKDVRKYIETSLARLGAMRVALG